MNLVEMPAVSVVLLVGVAGVLYGIVRTILSDTWKKRHLVLRDRHGTHGAGAAALCRLEQYGLLSFGSRPAKFADDRQQLLQSVHIGSDELCLHPRAFRLRLYFLCLACVGSAEDQRGGNAGERHACLLMRCYRLVP